MVHRLNRQDFFDEVDNVCLDSDFSELEKNEKVATLEAKYSRHFPVKDSDYHYFLGYASYKCKCLSEETEGHFREALRLDPMNDFCQYYFAYFLFDLKRYKEALEILENISLVKFKELKMTLKLFKINEAIACCYLFLVDSAEAIPKLDSFLTAYEKHVMVAENIYDDPINYPHEIIRSINEALDNLADTMKPIVARLTRLMEKEDLQTAYSDEYARFKKFLNLSVPEVKM